MGHYNNKLGRKPWRTYTITAFDGPNQYVIKAAGRCKAEAIRRAKEALKRERVTVRFLRYEVTL